MTFAVDTEHGLQYRRVSGYEETAKPRESDETPRDNEGVTYHGEDDERIYP